MLGCASIVARIVLLRRTSASRLQLRSLLLYNRYGNSCKSNSTLNTASKSNSVSLNTWELFERIHRTLAQVINLHSPLDKSSIVAVTALELITRREKKLWLMKDSYVRAPRTIDCSRVPSISTFIRSIIKVFGVKIGMIYTGVSGIRNAFPCFQKVSRCLPPARTGQTALGSFIACFFFVSSKIL